jgi:hypothetical protein
MICGRAQGILIKKARARSAEKINYYRRALRLHVEGCAFCQKAWKRRRVSVSRVRGVR